MSSHEFHCESCGHALASAQAVSPVCEAQFERERQLAAQGAYRCPVCSQTFNQAHFELWPRGASWYSPRQMKPVCPHCKAFLRDRLNPRLSARQVWLLAGATVLGFVAVPAGYEKLLLLLMLAIYVLAHLRLRERHVEPHERFAKDEAACE